MKILTEAGFSALTDMDEAVQEGGGGSRGRAA